MFGKDGPTFFELIQQALVSTRQGYDMLAPKFDATPFRTPDELIAPALAAVGRVDAALDVCCGTGAGMRLLKPMCARRVTGIDFSPGMLQIAKSKMNEIEGVAAVEFVEGDARSMNFNEEFDLATCFGALGHILPGEQRLFLQGIRRALKPGGRFVFITGSHPPILSPANLILRTFNAIMRVRNALIKPPFIMYYLTFLLPEIEAVLREEGFSVEVRRGVFEGAFSRYCVVIATRA